MVFAAQVKLRSDGKTEEANLIKEACFSSPTRAQKINKAWRETQGNHTVKPYTPCEALAVLSQADLSKSSYQFLRNGAKAQGADIYPPYYKVKEAKLECYPPNDADLIVTDDKVEIKLQALLDLTVSRLVQLQEPVLMGLPPSTLSELRLVSKWGCDGSGGHSLYKQKSDVDDLLFDSNVVMTCLVPLQIYVVADGLKKVVWQNPRPSSTRFCRPLRVDFHKETPEFVLSIKSEMDEQIKNLQPTIVERDAIQNMVHVEHDLCMSMIDGKTVNVLTGNASSQTCNVCGVTPKGINDIDGVLSRAIKDDTTDHGLSTLHAYIRFFEWLYHVSVRLEVKSWRKTKDLKEQVEAREQKIQKEFREQMGLLVGVVLQGKGTTHDGNTSRRFFENYGTSSSITGINHDLIFRCNVILKVMSCGFEVDTVAFKTYALDTARLYVREYGWYPMPAAVHRVLIHGADIISVALLPIGMLSEDAQESRNKDFRRYRAKRCKKTSRVETNKDLINILLTSSDPIISTLRPLPPKPKRSMCPAMLALLKGPTSPLSPHEPS